MVQDITIKINDHDTEDGTIADALYMILKAVEQGCKCGIIGYSTTHWNIETKEVINNE